MRRPLPGRNGVPAGKSLAKDSSPTMESRLRLQLVVGLDHLVVRGDYVQLWRDIFLGNEQLLPFVLPCRASLCTLAWHGRSYFGVCADSAGVRSEAEGHKPVVGAQKGRPENVLVCVNSSIELTLALDRAGRRDLPKVPEEHEEAEEIVQRRSDLLPAVYPAVVLLPSDPLPFLVVSGLPRQDDARREDRDRDACADHHLHDLKCRGSDDHLGDGCTSEPYLATGGKRLCGGAEAASRTRDQGAPAPPPVLFIQPAASIRNWRRCAAMTSSSRNARRRCRDASRAPGLSPGLQLLGSPQGAPCLTGSPQA